MTRKLRIISVLLAAFALVTWHGVSNSQVTGYVEDFTTTTYKDAGNTTAWWDDTTGQLRLYPFVPTLVGSYALPNYAYEVVVAGDRAFVANQYYGLQVIDISDPANPALIGGYNTTGTSYSVFIDGNYAYMADDYSGLVVIDITDPASPTLAGSYNTPGRAVDLWVAGEHVFVADGTSGLQIIDISNPTAPTLVGHYQTTTYNNGVHVSGNYAYILDTAQGVRVIDISDPSTPTLVSTYDTPGIPIGLFVDGNYVFVADGTFGLKVIDVTDPTTPVLTGSYDTPGEAYRIRVLGDRAYMTERPYGGGAGGLQIIDISDLSSPTLVGSYVTTGPAHGVDVTSEHTFITEGTSLHVIKTAERVAPTLTGSFSTSASIDAIDLEGNLAYVGVRFDGLRIFDITDLSSPTPVGHYYMPGNASAVVVEGNYAYLGQLDYDEPFHIVDVSDPTTPVRVGLYVTQDVVWGIDVSGPLAYVATRSEGLVIFDVSDPANPDSIGQCWPDYNCDAIEVAGDYAYIANVGAGLQVVDVSDPTAPFVAGFYDVSGFIIRTLAVRGDYLYTVNQDSGLVVIDISDPTTPVPIGSYTLPSPSFSIDVEGDYAFVMNSTNGMRILDVSNPVTPSLVGTYATAAGLAVNVRGDYAFTGISGGGVSIVQVFKGYVQSPTGTGRSLAVDQASDNFVRVSLGATQTDHVSWEVSVNGGSNWDSVQPDGSWFAPPIKGSDLLWRSSLLWQKPGDYPAIHDLTLDWRYDHGVITSIADVPGDQGGWVRVFFTRSGRDFAEETARPIDDYGIWQRVDDPLLVAAVDETATSAAGKGVEDIARVSGEIPVVIHDGKSYVRSGPDLAEGVFPPGTWELVLSVPAAQQDSYIARVPTTADSTVLGQHYSAYVLTAHTTTPSIWYTGLPDSGYSLDNIAPAIPGSFALAYNTGAGNYLTWDVCPDNDFQYHNVYRSTDPDFDPSPATLVHSTIGTDWNDPEYDGWNVIYKVTALDYAGNESPPASAGTATGITEHAMPKRVSLEQNVPNPFNPSTTISIGLPAAADVTLTVFDVSGRRVATLVDGPVPAGFRSFTWHGRDNNGRRVGSGVYFYRLEAGGQVFTRKMVLLK